MSEKQYKIVIAVSAQIEMENLPKNIKEWVTRDIYKKLTTNPIIFGKPLSGEFKGCFRLRVNDYRIIYKINQDIVTVYIIKVDHRKDVYD